MPWFALAFPQWMMCDSLAKVSSTRIGLPGPELSHMFLEQIRMTNLLSFGPDTPALPLRPLNVLIGPNGAGKSNPIEAISLLRSAPKHLGAEIRDSGGVRDWIWKGAKGREATVEVVAANHPQPHRKPIRHSMSFVDSASRFELVDERVEDSEPMPGYTDAYFYYRARPGKPVINVRGEQRRELRREDIDPEKSILSQRKDPDQYPEITYLGDQYERIRIYREWSFGRFSALRMPQEPNRRNDGLEENFLNLGLMLNRFRRQADLKRRLLDALQELYPGIEDFDVSIEAGSVQVFLHEGPFSIPATRLSDGTLRYLCLLAMLCHPEPPPLICIEEPELGLHPDVVSSLGGLLRDASTRTQLIVATHSVELIDALSESPDDVIVFEKQAGSTQMCRLSSAGLTDWLQQYALGELWRRGELGGNRW